MNSDCLALACALWVSLISPLSLAEVGLRDPTQPLNYRVQKTVKTVLTLQAIYVRENNKTAIVNGKTLQLGDVIDGYRLQGIASNSVNLIKNDQVLTLYLRKDVIKFK